ncbi:ergothioneine biosynthesis protein EgtB [Bacteriovoracales bacterium]|nr:ergothioneine biosynthesis protein EgtB [Bacteriovoracales bacterium]
MSDKKALSEHFLKTREQTQKLCSPLEIEDYVVQPHPDVSPPKWHLGHTTWFFESFLLHRERPFNPHFKTIFNSYYKSLGVHWDQKERGALSRPTVQEVCAYRQEINEKMLAHIDKIPEEEYAAFEKLTTLGIEHEKQHQELLVMDIKYIFAQNPLEPTYSQDQNFGSTKPSISNQIKFSEGTYSFGHESENFSYDNERPPHKDYLHSFTLSSHPVTNGEFLEFIEDGGYKNPNLWHSDGWDFINREKIKAPLYWFKRDNNWVAGGLQGVQKIDKEEILSHVSYFEASAYARWKGKRLPTEKEWERAASLVDFKNIEGQFLESGRLQLSSPIYDQDPFYDLFGSVWEWTESSYSPYPGYRRLEGPLGEYNGKFMSGQMVLRGGCLATPRDHLRKTYRNFYRPEKRWCFSGIRLAEDN